MNVCWNELASGEASRSIVDKVFFKTSKLGCKTITSLTFPVPKKEIPYFMQIPLQIALILNLQINKINRKPAGSIESFDLDSHLSSSYSSYSHECPFVSREGMPPSIHSTVDHHFIVQTIIIVINVIIIKVILEMVVERHQRDLASVVGVVPAVFPAVRVRWRPGCRFNRIRNSPKNQPKCQIKKDTCFKSCTASIKKGKKNAQKIIKKIAQMMFMLLNCLPEPEPPPPLQLLPRGQHEERGDHDCGRHDEEQHCGPVVRTPPCIVLDV